MAGRVPWPLRGLFSRRSCWVPVRRRRAVPLVLPGAFIVLTALAFASPPDNAWLPGIYDDADYDDVIALLTDTPTAGDSQPLAAEPSRLVLGLTVVGSTPARADASLFGFHLRSPPHSLSPQ